MVKKPVLLCILDGWGYRVPPTDDNAINVGNTPNWDRILRDNPNGIIETSGLDVGLPDGQMGNSEVGHMNIGAGRVVMQDLPRIDKAVKTGEINGNETLKSVIAKLKESKGAMHLMGLASPGGVHSHQKHIIALAKVLSENHVPVKIHCFLDGRDTPPTSAKGFVTEIEKEIAGFDNVKVSTVSGRFYGMDRDKRWDRVELAYDAICEAKGERATTSDEAIANSYAKSENDEFVKPTVIADYDGMQDGDAVLMANFRADRAREITYALCDKEFDGFARNRVVKLAASIAMTEYSVDHNRFMEVLFPPQVLSNIFGEIIAKNNMKQLRIAETEKYAHVTFFFNGGEEKEFDGEDRILIPSPKVATYDLQPEMSAPEVADKLVEAIKADKYDVIVCNFANGDMVGHTGMMGAAVRAVEAVDECLGKVEQAIKDVDGVMFLTADHGNCEMMVNPETGEPYTAHTVGKVYSILVNSGDVKSLKDGKLADIAPTLLELLNIEQPAEMTGSSVIVK